MGGEAKHHHDDHTAVTAEQVCLDVVQRICTSQQPDAALDEMRTTTQLHALKAQAAGKEAVLHIHFNRASHPLGKYLDLAQICQDVFAKCAVAQQGRTFFSFHCPHPNTETPQWLAQQLIAEDMLSAIASCAHPTGLRLEGMYLSSKCTEHTIFTKLQTLGLDFRLGKKPRTYASKPPAAYTQEILQGYVALLHRLAKHGQLRSLEVRDIFHAEKSIDAIYAIAKKLAALTLRFSNTQTTEDIHRLLKLLKRLSPYPLEVRLMLQESASFLTALKATCQRYANNHKGGLVLKIVNETKDADHIPNVIWMQGAKPSPAIPEPEEKEKIRQIHKA